MTKYELMATAKLENWSIVRWTGANCPRKETLMQSFRSQAKTIVPVIARPKEQLVGPAAPKVRLIHSISEPEYRTEIEVTRAIAAGTFRGFANEAYAKARQFQAYLRRSRMQPSFRFA